MSDARHPHGADARSNAGLAPHCRSHRRESILHKGYTVVQSAVDDDLLHTLRYETATLVDHFYNGQIGGADYWSYSLRGKDKPILYRIHNLEKQGGCPEVKRLFDRGPLHDIASECLGQQAFPTVCAAVIKIPHVGAPVPWHRDRHHDEVGPGQAVNVSLYMHDSDARNGCLKVVPNSQGLDLGADPEEWVRGRADTVVVPVQAGDATVHDVRLIHGSGANPGDALCIRIVMEFRAASLPAEVLRRD